MTDLQRITARLKRCSAYWRRKSSIHKQMALVADNPSQEFVRSSKSADCANVAAGLDEAIAIIEKSVSERGVRRKRRL